MPDVCTRLAPGSMYKGKVQCNCADIEHQIGSRVVTQGPGEHSLVGSVLLEGLKRYLARPSLRIHRLLLIMLFGELPRLP